MTQDQFKQFLKDLGAYFGLEKIISTTRFEQWFERVKLVPSEALPHIFNRFSEEKDTIPRNVPKVMLAYFYQWHSTSGKAIGYQHYDCDECGGHGLIWCRRPSVINGELLKDRSGKPLFEEVSYRCAKCENWQRHVHQNSKPAATRAELFERGYELV